MRDFLRISIGVSLWIAVFLVAMPAPVLGGTGPDPAIGMFLIANPGMRDPRFQESVILLLKHDEMGSLGLVVNRQTRVILQEILPEADRPGLGDKQVFIGGPLSLRDALVLVRSDNPPEDSSKIFGRVHLTGIDQLLEHSSRNDRAPDFHIYVGHAGWAPGQLQEELERGVWLVVPADENSVFDSEPERVWERLKAVIRIVI